MCVCAPSVSHAALVRLDEAGSERVRAIIMHPSWYGSVWVYLAWLAGGAGIVFLFMWWRLQHLKRQQKDLAALVARRTLQLHESQEELRRAGEAAECANRVRSAFLANM